MAEPETKPEVKIMVDLNCLNLTFDLDEAEKVVEMLKTGIASAKAAGKR
jgi:hypothetical protein